VAFAVGELGLRLEEFYDMPFCEFRIKAYAYKRMQEERLRHTRMIAYYSAIGPHLDPKKLPKTIDEFMRIGDKPKKRSMVSDEMRELYKKRMDEYNEAMRVYREKHKDQDQDQDTDKK
jgi:isopropylmalate/homocitrate/citramalate synthase